MEGHQRNDILHWPKLSLLDDDLSSIILEKEDETSHLYTESLPNVSSEGYAKVWLNLTASERVLHEGVFSSEDTNLADNSMW